MRLRRKGSATEPDTATDEAATDDLAAETPGRGPRDSGDVELAEGEYADLGSLWILPMDDREVRLQVDEASGQVASVLVAGADGALELRAFAAPRGGELWADVRPQIQEELTRAGGEVAEREGPFGPELLARVSVTLPDGRVGEQHSRMLGIDGPRWFLRATYVGGPATTEEAPEDWLAVLDSIVVHRGTEAMPPSEQLPLVLPSGARKLG